MSVSLDLWLPERCYFHLFSRFLLNIIAKHSNAMSFFRRTKFAGVFLAGSCPKLMACQAHWTLGEEARDPHGHVLKVLHSCGGNGRICSKTGLDLMTLNEERHDPSRDTWVFDIKSTA